MTSGCNQTQFANRFCVKTNKSLCLTHLYCEDQRWRFALSSSSLSLQKKRPSHLPYLPYWTHLHLLFGRTAADSPSGMSNNMSVRGPVCVCWWFYGEWECVGDEQQQQLQQLEVVLLRKWWFLLAGCCNLCDQFICIFCMLEPYWGGSHTHTHTVVSLFLVAHTILLQLLLHVLLLREFTKAQTHRHKHNANTLLHTHTLWRAHSEVTGRRKDWKSEIWRGGGMPAAGPKASWWWTMRWALMGLMTTKSVRHELPFIWRLWILWFVFFCGSGTGCMYVCVRLLLVFMWKSTSSSHKKQSQTDANLTVQFAVLSCLLEYEKIGRGRTGPRTGPTKNQLCGCG